jgi:hypothetical protein
MIERIIGSPTCRTCVGNIWRPAGPMEDGDLVCVTCHGPVAPAQVVGVDPGLRATGVAYWDGTTMIAQTIRPGGRPLADRVREICQKIEPRSSVAVIEIPQVYEHEREKDPNDLVSLALGSIGGGYRSTFGS